ncbi:MAG: hypothetical protein Q9191_006039, partial [Dirinaria sp. TL-2023a]
MRFTYQAATLVVLIWTYAAYALPAPQTSDSLSFPQDWLLKEISPTDGPLTPEGKRQNEERAEFSKRDVSSIQAETATHGTGPGPKKRHQLTDAQLDALAAADESPSDNENVFDAPIGSTPTLIKDKDNQPLAEKTPPRQIYKVVKAGFSDDEISALFHSEDGTPIRLTDDQVDAAIAVHEHKGSN